ncbi:uncharacterized protein LOC131954295 [Physella acuta]|uniref:uncharacterized protein LOC131954295 n=1 Tax=Physella acuta TaxID=109671 RepID=UPI0027DCD933|nr:uncharacterized protein LOC131954295 [Physella acuta]
MASSSKIHITLALTGRVGNGKSACGNSILGKRVFPTSDDVESCTHKNRVGSAERMNTDIKVMDTPGVMDCDDYRNLENITFHLPDVISICQEGINAFCLVLKYGAINMQQEIQAVKQIKEVYGKTVLNDYGIIIMTNGDSFDQNYDGKEDNSFLNWCKKQTGDLEILMKECNFRVVLFYNTGGQYETKRESSVDQLLGYAIRLHRIGPYTKTSFENNFKEREKEILEHKLYDLILPFSKHMGIMMNDIFRIIKQGFANENDVHCLKKSNEELLKKIFHKVEDTKIQAKLFEKVQLIQRKLVILDLNKPIAGQLDQVLKILEELKNPPMSTQLKVCLGTAAAALLLAVILCREK